MNLITRKLSYGVAAMRGGSGRSLKSCFTRSIGALTCTRSSFSVLPATQCALLLKGLHERQSLYLKSLTLLYFMEYSRGMPTIPEDSFARLLLRNTSLEEEQVQKYLNRLCKRLKQRKVRK